MERTNHANLPVGTPVHVEFDGEVYHVSEHASSNVQPSPNHIAVSDGSYIHHVHVNSPNLAVQSKPRPAVELGQVWRTQTGDAGKSYVVYDRTDHAFTEPVFYFCGPRTDGGQCAIRDEEFLSSFPDAFLLLDTSGGLAE